MGHPEVSMKVKGREASPDIKITVDTHPAPFSPEGCNGRNGLIARDSTFAHILPVVDLL